MQCGSKTNRLKCIQRNTNMHLNLIYMLHTLHTIPNIFPPDFPSKSCLASNNTTALYLLLSAPHVLSSLLFSSCSSSSFIRLCIKRGGLAVCAVRGGCVSVLFCSFIGWGCEWKALRSRSPLFLSSCVLTFSLSLSLSPSRTTHWVSTHSETEARQDLSAQPGPPTRSWQGTPISTSQPIKVSFAAHM